MMNSLDVRRHPDGSIDFDFYRQRAVRQRRLARRLVFRHFLIAAERVVRAVISTNVRSTVHRSLSKQARAQLMGAGQREASVP